MPDLSDQFVRTPLGDYEFDAGAGGTASIKQIRDLFNAKGTQQLLGNYINPSFTLDNTVGDAWRSELQLKGYPQQTRNIAISNGSHCALGQDFAANSSIFSMKGKIRTGVLTDILGAALGISDDIALAIIFNEPALLLGILPGSSKFNIDFNAKALPELNQSANIYRGVFSYTKRFLWLVPITVNLSNRSYNNPVSLPIDTYPGGQYEFLNDLDGINFFDDGDGEDDLSQLEADLLNALLANGNIDFAANPTFNFIPTPSALDAGGGLIALNDGDYRFKYNADNPPNGSKPIPFDNYTTSYDVSGLNERHISFNARNGDWLALELDNIAGNEDNFNCTFSCDIASAEIQGPDEFCTTATFSLPPGANDYNWFFPGGSVSIPDPLQPNVVQVQGFTDGYHTLQARIEEPGCGINQTFTKTIYFGTPTTGGNLIEINADTTPVLSIYPDDGSYCDIVAYQVINWPNFEVVNNIEMRKVSGDSYWDGNMRTGRDLRVAFFPSCNEVFVFEVRVENECGWSDWQEFSVDLQVCDTTCGTQTPPTSGIQSENFIISPVPASTIIAIDMKQDPQWEFFSLDCSDGIYDIGGNTLCTYYVDVKLFDSHGNQVLYITGHQLGSSFDVSHLQTGTYFLQLQHGSFQIETHQIPIN